MVDQSSSKHLDQSFSEKHTYEGKAIHPILVGDYKSKKKIKIPLSQGDAKHYGHLTDKSLFAEYAWEFLRRNRFYQAMIDNVNPSFDLDEWGYSAGPSHAASCGLTQPYKHYAESYEENPPEWAPLWAISARLHETLRSREFSRTSIEYPGQQVPFVFDIASTFGPGSIGLQMQADLAVKSIEEYLKARNQRPPPGLINRPGKPKLRMYLRLADLMSYPQKIEPADGAPTAKNALQLTMITATQAAHKLEDFNFNDESKLPKTPVQRQNCTYDRVENARTFIYEWLCLTLLTFSKQEDEPKKEKKRCKEDTRQENNGNDALPSKASNS